MFGTRLENAVRGIAGGQAAILMGLDGIPVDFFSLDEQLDIETVGMEFSVILKEVRKTVELLGSGKAQELTVRTNAITTVVRLVNDGYFIAMTLDSTGNLGKARYTLRMLAPQISNELT